MAGIYIHIPYCSKKCFYCDFYSVKLVNNNILTDFVEVLKTEINLQKNYLDNEIIDTIYFGGGTPSLLNINQVIDLINHIKQNFKINSDVEITFEANPDNMNLEYLKLLKETSLVNRLSIGIQSFINKELLQMNRTHTAEQNFTAIENARSAGFDNISLDLIYGLPDSTLETINFSLANILKYKPEHISAYHLTYEQGTVFYKYLENKKIKQIQEDESIAQFMFIVNELEKSGYEHYEISNFAKPGLKSKHNSAYWEQKHYQGLGPSAHSFNGFSRQWNVANVTQYIHSVRHGEIAYTTEILSETDIFNEYLMTRLRTSEGINLLHLKKSFKDIYCNHFFSNIKRFISSGELLQTENNVYLSLNGKFISDYIISELFIS